MSIFALYSITNGYLGDTAALAAVALIGYLFGHRTRRQPADNLDQQLRIELCRASEIAKELQQTADRIRRDVAAHQSSITQFTASMHALQTEPTSEDWQELGNEAEALLVPTMKLTTSLSLAYDQLRRHSMQLMTFAGSRTDSQTGVLNRRAMEEQLDVLLSIHSNGGARFSLSLFSIAESQSTESQYADFENIDSENGEHCEEASNEQLQAFAQMIESSARDTDFVARYSEDEFVVLMPQTTLAGATVFSERLVDSVKAELDFDMAGGIVEVLGGEGTQKILSRADSALYSARAQGCSCLFQHNGTSLRQLDSGHVLSCISEAVAVS